jgi:predicted ATP-grasp superfamily ATP-dependent carboligase
MYLQQRVAGRPGSAVFVASHGTAHLLGITRQLVGMAWTHAAEFQYAGSIGPWHLNVAAFEDVHRAGQALARLGLVGLFGIDFVLAADGRAWILEVNPRYTASVEVVERASGVGVMAWHVAAVSGDGSALASAASPPPSRRRGAGTIRESRARGEGGGTVCGHYGKAILFARQDVFVTTEFADWALERTAIPPRWPELADLPRGGTRIFAGRPVVTVFAEGTSKDDVENLLRQDAAEIEQRLLR